MGVFFLLWRLRVTSVVRFSFVVSLRNLSEPGSNGWVRWNCSRVIKTSLDTCILLLQETFAFTQFFIIIIKIMLRGGSGWRK